MSARNRLLRERQRAGLSCHLLTDIPEVALLEALQAEGFLSTRGLDPSHAEVTAALRQAVLRLIEVDDENN